MFEQGASDLHLTAGAPPALRIDGDIRQLELERLSPSQTQRLAYSLLNDEQKEKFERDHELDLSFGLAGLGRVRMNVFMQRGTVASVMRNIPSEVRSFDDLQLPPVVKEIVKIPRGLVLVTGVTGSGKSTTLAAMIDYINTNRKTHIVTIEDPIEFVHKHKSSIVDQREVMMDTKAFARSLQSALRQGTDVVLVGELRNLETIEATLTLAETGRLVFGTLHTGDAVETVNRIIDVYPHYQQAQVKVQLSFVLQAVLAQQLFAAPEFQAQFAGLETFSAHHHHRRLLRREDRSRLAVIGCIGFGLREEAIGRLGRNDIRFPRRTPRHGQNDHPR
ncbi:MAG: PilT/PilU family type 4a pilus ATPase, partial [bacterium]